MHVAHLFRASNPNLPQTRNPLFQPDLFYCVLDSLVPPEADYWHSVNSEALPVLSALAQTCRAFSEPALDRLWSKLISLTPLIRSFATVANEERAKIPPSTAEWTIIRRYSHRIKDLVISTSDHISLFFLNHIYSTSSPLIPNLRSLAWHMDGFGESHSPVFFIQKLLNPSLVSLDVYLHDMNHVASQSFLANYHLLSPNLKSVSIGTSKIRPFSPLTVACISQSISSHNCPEYLDVSVPVDDVALLHTARSTTLKKLTLVLHPELSNLSRIYLPPDVVPFRNVQVLSLDICDLSFMTALLRAQDQIFRSLALQLGSKPSIDAISTFFIALLSPQRTHSLQSLVLKAFSQDMEDTDSGDEESLPRSVIRFDTLKPLTSLHHLCKLDIDIGYWISINDDDLDSLACNWPSLETFRLNWDYSTGPPRQSVQYVTLKGLSFLPRHCPGLDELALPVDARQVPLMVDTDMVDVGRNIISMLAFPNSPIDNADSVGDFLVRHFPHVKDLAACFYSWANGEATRYNSLWNRVKRYVWDKLHLDSDSCLDSDSGSDSE